MYYRPYEAFVAKPTKNVYWEGQYMGQERLSTYSPISNSFSESLFDFMLFLRHDKFWNSLSDLLTILPFSLEMHSCWLADKVNWSSTLVFQLPSPSIRVGSKLLRCKKKFAPEIHLQRYPSLFPFTY